MVDHNPVDPNIPPGIEGIKQTVPMFRTAFPDLQFNIVDLIAEGDKVVSRLTIQATHKGEFMGISPTGKQVSITGIDIVRIVDGKMVELWGEVDMLRLMQNLGVVPPIK